MKEARIVVLCHQKGGVGKTSVAMLMSAELAKRGHRVLVADCDEQATASRWAHAAADDTPFPAAVVNYSACADKVHREIQKQVDLYDFIIIDCPPTIDAPLPQALLIAHLALIPCPPAPADLWSTVAVKELISRSQVLNEGMKAAILPNKVLRTSLSKAVMEELKAFGIPVMASRLSGRTAYQEAVIAGSTVANLGRDARPAAEEVRALTDEVLALLGEQE